MTGSRKWFLYTSDHDINFAVQLDESNAETMGFLPYSDTVLGQSKLEAPYTITPVPTNLEMRYCNAKAVFTDSVTGQVVNMTKRFVIPTIDKLTTFLTTAGGRKLPPIPIVYNGIVQNVTFHITSTIGEIWKNLPSSYDTFQNDGDTDQAAAGGGGGGQAQTAP